MARRATPAAALLHDLPTAVGLLAGGAVAFLRLAADGDGLLELTAIGPVGLIGRARHHRSGGAGIRILPVDALAGAAGIERRLGRLVGIGDVGLVEPAAELVAEQAAKTGTDESAAGRLVHPDFPRLRPAAVRTGLLTGGECERQCRHCY